VADTPVDGDDPQPAVPTLLERMASVMSEAKAREWITVQRVVVDGESADDPDRRTPRGQRWHINQG
jgi:16S rRNA U516 pseudouridylate synthase RsuA-like enzyme